MLSNPFPLSKTRAGWLHWSSCKGKLSFVTRQRGQTHAEQRFSVSLSRIQASTKATRKLASTIVQTWINYFEYKQLENNSVLFLLRKNRHTTCHCYPGGEKRWLDIYIEVRTVLKKKTVEHHNLLRSVAGWAPRVHESQIRISNYAGLEPGDQFIQDDLIQASSYLWQLCTTGRIRYRGKAVSYWLAK